MSLTMQASDHGPERRHVVRTVNLQRVGSPDGDTCLSRRTSAGRGRVARSTKPWTLRRNGAPPAPAPSLLEQLLEARTETNNQPESESNADRSHHIADRSTDVDGGAGTRRYRRACRRLLRLLQGTTNKVRPVNAIPVCKSSETLRSWNEAGAEGPQGPPGVTSCHPEEFPGTAPAGTFGVTNMFCATGHATGSGFLWTTPFDGANNGTAYFFPRGDNFWTCVPYNATGSSRTTSATCSAVTERHARVAYKQNGPRCDAVKLAPRVAPGSHFDPRCNPNACMSL